MININVLSTLGDNVAGVFLPVCVQPQDIPCMVIFFRSEVLEGQEKSHHGCFNSGMIACQVMMFII